MLKIEEIEDRTLPFVYLLLKANLPNLHVQRTKLMPLYTLKNVNDIAPSVLHVPLNKYAFDGT